MTNIKGRFKRLPRLAIFIIPAIIPVAIVLFVSAFLIYFHGRVYPGIVIGSNDVSAMTLSETLKEISTGSDFSVQVTVRAGEQTGEHRITKEAIGLEYFYEDTVLQAYRHGRSGNFFEDLEAILNGITQKREIPLSYKVDSEKLEGQVGLAAAIVTEQPETPKLAIEAGVPVLSEGKAGYMLDRQGLKKDILGRIENNTADPILISASFIDSVLDEAQKKAALERAQKYVDKSITLFVDFEEFFYGDDQLVAWLDPSGGYQDGDISSTIEAIASKVDRPPQNPVFVQSGNRVTEFSAAKDGLVVDRNDLAGKIVSTLKQIGEEKEYQASIEIAVVRKDPELATEEVNSLGIRELIGRGTSTFRGSPSERVYNINLAATRINGTLIAPGEVFSFNGSVGEIDKLNGYKESLIIQNGETILGDGGGVCQVSTTVFRAALDAGLPIVNRRGHSFRVGYYEQDSAPGIDATIYSPVVDLKFKNDTGHHILVQAIPDTANYKLAFEFYGTSDGRVANISTPVTKITAPVPEPLYEDDPTLPVGTEVHEGYAYPGSSASFNYTVTRGNETIESDTFNSYYKPQQIKIRRGVGS